MKYHEGLGIFLHCHQESYGFYCSLPYFFMLIFTIIFSEQENTYLTVQVSLRDINGLDKEQQ